MDRSDPRIGPRSDPRADPRIGPRIGARSTLAAHRASGRPRRDSRRRPARLRVDGAGSARTRRSRPRGARAGRRPVVGRAVAVRPPPAAGLRGRGHRRRRPEVDLDSRSPKQDPGATDRHGRPSADNCGRRRARRVAPESGLHRVAQESTPILMVVVLSAVRRVNVMVAGAARRAYAQFHAAAVAGSQTTSWSSPRSTGQGAVYDCPIEAADAYLASVRTAFAPAGAARTPTTPRRRAARVEPGAWATYSRPVSYREQAGTGSPDQRLFGVAAVASRG